MTSARSLTRPTAHGTSAETVIDWRQEGACVGESPTLFEPDDRRTPPPEAWDLPRSICAECPVRDLCLEDALTPGRRSDFGMRGGLTPDERRRAIKRRNRWANRGGEK